jgi:hypothetical protein
VINGRHQGITINDGLTYAYESKLKQLLIRYSKSPSKKVVTLVEEGCDTEEGKAGEANRNILVALIPVTMPEEYS